MVAKPCYSCTVGPWKSRYHAFLRWLLRSGQYQSARQDPAHDGFVYEELTKKPPRFSGWRGGCLLASISAASVLLLNLIFTIWAAVTAGSGFSIGTLYLGDCSTAGRANSWLHIAINIMATGLLSASNYTMQCLAAPTRTAIDASHKQGRHLDIGLPSLRNLRGFRRITLFSFLVLSTLPLHFLCALHSDRDALLMRM